jgi:hypothetical protein
MADFSDSFSDYDLIRKRGDTVRMPFTFTTLSGVPSAYEIWFYGKLQPNMPDSEAVFALDTTGGGVVITDDPGKKIEAVIPADATIGFVGKTVVYCEYQIKALAAPGDVQTVIGSCGKITFLVDVVRTIA